MKTTDGFLTAEKPGPKSHVRLIFRGKIVATRSVRSSCRGATCFHLLSDRNRNDSDGKWGAEMILSKGIRYSYSPAMSVEGQKVVVVWSGIGKPQHGKWGEYAPSDIYFATSSDNGRTWKTPTRVTDNMKSGLTAGRPRVVLHKNVIHLFYIQGKFEENFVAPGIKYLKLPPWDIIYQHRQFPN